MLEQLHKNIWVANQKQKYHGLEIGTRMTVIRFNCDQLILISPITINPALRKELSALGEVKYIFAPNIYHHFYLEACSKTYSKAKVYVAEGLGAKYANLKCSLLTENVPQELAEYIEQISFCSYAVQELSGPVVLNEMVFFHRESRALILTDAAYHFKPKGLLSKLCTKLFGLYGVLGPSILEKRAIKEPQKTKEAIVRVLEWPFEIVIMAHGEIVKNKAKEKLKSGYEWLLT
jgi:hypothetical protein